MNYARSLVAIHSQRDPPWIAIGNLWIMQDWPPATAADECSPVQQVMDKIG